MMTVEHRPIDGRHGFPGAPGALGAVGHVGPPHVQ